MKECKECKIEKPFADYINQGAYRHPKCNKCRLQYAKEYHHKRKLKKKTLLKKKNLNKRKKRNLRNLNENQK